MFSLSSRLPLLSKELKEQANRKRMYVIRVVYALIMLVVAIACLVDLHYTYQRNPMAALGYGRYVFEAVVISHLMAIYSLIPLLAAGSLADERERNTLPLLLLTRLDPWTIVIEKILGHAVPMLVLLLVSLPVAGFAYSMGGVNEPQLLMAIWLLPLAVFQITALVVMCSAASRTTVTAGLSAIAIGTAVVLITALIDEFGRIHSPWLYCLIIPAFFEFGSSMPFSDLVILSIPAMVSTVVFVVMARWFLVRSLIANEGWSVRGLTERLIGFFRGPAPVPCDPPAKVQITSLPEQRPVLWREVRRTYLGQLRNQLIVIAAAGLLMTPLLYFLTIHPGRQDEEFAVVYFCYLGFRRSTDSGAVCRTVFVRTFPTDARRAAGNSAQQSGNHRAEAEFRVADGMCLRDPVDHHRTGWILGTNSCSGAIGFNVGPTYSIRHSSRSRPSARSCCTR